MSRLWHYYYCYQSAPNLVLHDCLLPLCTDGLWSAKQHAPGFGCPKRLATTRITVLLFFRLSLAASWHGDERSQVCRERLRRYCRRTSGFPGFVRPVGSPWPLKTCNVNDGTIFAEESTDPIYERSARAVQQCNRLTEWRDDYNRQ